MSKGKSSPNPSDGKGGKPGHGAPKSPRSGKKGQ
jgi:hypothetical protein